MNEKNSETCPSGDSRSALASAIERPQSTFPTIIRPGVLTVLDDHASPPAPSKHTYRLVVTQHRIKLVVARACVPEIIVAAGLPVGSAWVLRNQTEERLALSSESDVLEQLEGNNTGPRMLAPQDQAVLVKIEPTRWTVWGLDLS
jgi:hypothetical protein